MNIVMQFQPETPIIIKETHPILQHIISNKCDKLKLSLKKNDINGLYPCKELTDEVTPLIAAIASNNIDIFSFLLHQNANPNTLSRKGCAPLRYASVNEAHIFFVERLLAEKANPNANINDPLVMTPLHVAATNDRDDIATVLIGAGAVVTTFGLAVPTYDAYNDKISSMIHHLASNGVPLCSDIQYFVDLEIAVSRKTPEEVFQLFDEVMLLKNPQTQLSIVNIMLGVTGQRETEYHTKCIQWLKDRDKMNLYIEDAVEHLSNLNKERQCFVIGNLQTVFCTLTEIPNNVSLALIPKLLGLLSTLKLFPGDEDLVVVTLYMIVQKCKVKDDWNLELLEKLMSGTYSFVHNHPSTAMYAYGIFANLVSTKHANRMFESIGLHSVPKDILTAAEMGMDDNLKNCLRDLQKYFLRPSPASEVSVPTDQKPLAPRKNKKKKKRKSKNEEQNNVLHNTASDLCTTSVQESVVNGIQPGLTTFKKERKWFKISKRWSEKLEKLSKYENIIKVGSIMFINDEEFRIAKGSDGTEVFLGLREDGTEVAVKRISRSQFKVLKNEESFLRLPMLDHKSIVKYVDFAEDEYFGYLALQLCECTLEEYLKDVVPEEQKRTLVKEVFSSLEVLHSQSPPILHRDIQPQNVLLDICGKARLADFGICRRLPVGQATLHTRSAGTKCWMARETLDETLEETVPYKMSADIQVAGMLTYYILSGGHHPFGKGFRCESNIFDGKYDLEHIKDVTALDLVTGMIDKNPKGRPTVKQCLGHPYFWPTLRKVEYLRRVGNEDEVRNYQDTPKCLLDELNQDVGEASWKNWRQKIPTKTLEKMDPKGKYHENTAGLLRFMRNLREHHPAGTENIDLMATFPDLFGGVFVFAQKKGWNSRDSLKDVFQIEDDLISGRTINMLNLEDQATGFSVPVQESAVHSVTVIP